MSRYLIFVPVYNEENNILRFLNNLFNFINLKTDEVLIIDDNSSDNTKIILNNILQLLKRNNLNLKNKLKIIFSGKNLGYGSNVLKGMEWFVNSDNEFFITIDSDFQHLASYINIFKSLAFKYNFITGSRYSKCSPKLSEYNYYRYLINKKMLEFLKFYFPKYKYTISDFFCGFRLYSKNIIKKIFKNLKEKEKKIKGFSYEFPIFLWIELFKLTDLKLKEVPIPYITFSERSFKGNKSFELNDHYQRIKKYIDIFSSELVSISKLERGGRAC